MRAEEAAPQPCCQVKTAHREGEIRVFGRKWSRSVEIILTVTHKARIQRSTPPVHREGTRISIRACQTSTSYPQRTHCGGRSSIRWQINFVKIFVVQTDYPELVSVGLDITDTHHAHQVADSDVPSNSGRTTSSVCSDVRRAVQSTLGIGGQRAIRKLIATHQCFKVNNKLCCPASVVALFRSVGRRNKKCCRFWNPTNLIKLCMSPDIRRVKHSTSNRVIRHTKN